MDNPTPKQDDPQPAINADGKPSPAEIRLYVAYWAEIQREMNRLLAEEED